MDIASQIDRLATQLSACKPSVRVKFDPSPTGLTFLNVGVGQRWFIMAYYPKHGGIGVDENVDVGLEMGYHNWFTEFEPAKEKFLAMLKEASGGSFDFDDG